MVAVVVQWWWADAVVVLMVEVEVDDDEGDSGDCGCGHDCGRGCDVRRVASGRGWRLLFLLFTSHTPFVELWKRRLLELSNVFL
jgi:hypothetical protein